MPEIHDSDAEQEQSAVPPAEQINELGSVAAQTGSGGGQIYCLTVIGQIEGHYLMPDTNKTTKYEHVIPQLVSADQDPGVRGMLVLLNTAGGDVEAGLALAEMIHSMRKPTVSLVLGGGHSIGVPLAVAARRSFIVPSATMTIHPVRMNGIIVGVPQAFTHFDRIQERIIRFICSNSTITPVRFRELMLATGEMASDVGTILDGQEAVNEGLIGALGGLRDAVAALEAMG